MIIPSIDIMDGKAVQLKQGKEKVLEKENVLELAKYFSRFGEIAVIDLDAAMGKGDNTELIKEICKIADCRVGGGIRTIKKAKEMLAIGAKKIIIGTAASEMLLQQLPTSRVLVAIDSNKDGKVVTEGWTKDTGSTPEEYVKRFDNLCSGYLYTIVEKEGMMGGTDVDAIKKVRALTSKEIIAAGGIASVDEVLELEKLGVSCQLGMGIYTGKINLEEAFTKILDFKKVKGLIPTVVQDIKSKQVLMLAYSNEEAVKKSLETGKATYFSRSRNELWTKGLTSGNTQELIKAKYDCDKDTLLYMVEQVGPACHTGSYSCFGDKDFDVNELYDVLVDRFKELPENSFTTKLFNNDFFLRRKIMEEAFEVVNFQEGDGLEWEAADLAYFVLTLMVKQGVTPQDILNNLASRRK